MAENPTRGPKHRRHYEERDETHLPADELDLIDPEAEETPAPQPRFAVDELLAHLVTSPTALTGRDLYAFSDLSRTDAELVRREWSAIPTERRRTVVTNLVEMAQETIDLELGRFLRIALHDSDAVVRESAIVGLWEETDANLLGPLIEVMRQDPSMAVRAAAATALGNYVLAGELGELDTALTMRAEQALLDVVRNMDEPLPVQCRALESLAYSGEAGVRQLIEDAYYAPEEEMRVSALIAMGRSADVHWRSYVRAELQNTSVAMRAEAAKACGDLEVKSAVSELLELLTDDEPSVRLAAIFALGHIGGNEAKRALRAIAVEGEPAEVEAAENALEELTFYTGNEGIALLDEEADDGEWEDEPWRARRRDDDDLGEYEDDGQT